MVLPWTGLSALSPSSLTRQLARVKPYPRRLPERPAFASRSTHRPGELGTGSLPTGNSGLIAAAVTEVYDTVTKAALVQQLEVGTDAGRQGTLATTN